MEAPIVVVFLVISWMSLYLYIAIIGLIEEVLDKVI